jgi:hypothetical protein
MSAGKENAGKNADTGAVDEATQQSAAQIVEYVESAYDLGRTTDGLLFAASKDPAAARRAIELRSLRSVVTKELYRTQGKVPGSNAVAAAFDTLAAIAEDGPVSSVHLRAAKVGTALHIDLGDREGNFVEVSPYGWEVRRPGAEKDPEAARPLFRTTRASHELPEPVLGGSRDEFRELLGLDVGDPRWLLIWGWLVASLVEYIPRPILWALGSQGSGKTTRTRMILDLIDPADRLGSPPGKNERDDSTNAGARFVPTWDNIGHVSAATSDWMCRLVTGATIDRRALYSDDDLRTRTIQRTGIATSIVLPYGLGADALERLVLVEFERLPEDQRRSETSLRRKFEEARPRILGALLTDLAGVMRYLSGLQDAEREGALGFSLPRMADYALVLHALDAYVGGVRKFADAYGDSVRNVLADRALNDPFTAALIKHAKAHKGKWRGPASGLLAAIERDRPNDPKVGWPHGPQGLSAVIETQAETLRAAGLLVDFGKSDGKRYVELELIRNDTEDDGEPGNVVELHPDREKVG